MIQRIVNCNMLEFLGFPMFWTAVKLIQLAETDVAAT